jgi:hypothetical protein
MEYELTELEVQLQRLRCEESSLRKRHEIALRILRRGYDPRIIFELSQEGLDELEKRLARLEEEERLQRTMRWFILSLVRKRKRQLPLRFDGLSKDPLRVIMVRTANLESELNELTIQLKQIENQTQIVMGYEDSEDQIARLDSSKARIEKELRRKQEELTRLKTNLGT